MRVSNAIVGLVAAALCLSGVAACGGDDDTSTGTTRASSSSATQIDAGKPVVRFALTAAKTPGVNLLPDFETGAQAAIKRLNAQGGFGGRKVVLDSCNTMNSPAITATCARKALANDPIAEWGCEPAWTAAGLPLFARAKVPSFNCPNSSEDFHNEMSFGISGGVLTDVRGTSRYLCSRPEVKTVAIMVPEIPSFHDAVGKSVPVLTGCGKKVPATVYYPLTAADPTPYVSQVLHAKPDFVIMMAIGAQTVALFKGFQGSGFPASKIAAPDTDFVYNEILSKAGTSMDGAYVAGNFENWGNTDAPDVAQYTKDMQAVNIDPRNPSYVWGYSQIMMFYAAAKQIGFDQFNADSLTQFMRTKTDVRFPMSRAIVNPGPASFPQLKQPYIRLMQWKGGKMVPVEGASTKDGWVFGG